jgi:hypothetical protein
VKSSKHRKRPSHIDRSVAAPATPNPATATDEASLPAVIASEFTRLRHAKRARVLQRLLTPVGPMALAVLAGGAFAKFAAQARLSISIDDAARVTWNQVFELGRYIEQSSPHVLHEVMTALSRDATAVAAVGASVTALVVRHFARRGGEPQARTA